MRGQNRQRAQRLETIRGANPVEMLHRSEIEQLDARRSPIFGSVAA
jgi:hypothetical protein